MVQKRLKKSFRQLEASRNFAKALGKRFPNIYGNQNIEMRITRILSWENFWQKMDLDALDQIRSDLSMFQSFLFRIDHPNLGRGTTLESALGMNPENDQAEEPDTSQYKNMKKNLRTAIHHLRDELDIYILLRETAVK